jgi:hypothetical protein
VIAGVVVVVMVVVVVPAGASPLHSGTFAGQVQEAEAVSKTSPDGQV